MKFNNLKLIPLFFVLFTLINIGYSAVFISGIDYTESLDINSNTFNFNVTLANSESKVFSNLILKYSFVNLENLGLVHEGSEKYSFNNNEVKMISKQIELENIPSGEYSFNLILTEATGAPIAGMKYDIDLINNNDILNLPQLSFVKTPHMLALNELGEIVQQSYGSLGNNIPKSADKFVEFTLENPRDLELNTKIELFHSYSIEDKLIDFTQELIISKSQDTYKLDLDYTIPGTYIVKTTFYSQQNKLFSKELRMVIAGESASIVSVVNSKDTYNQNENLEISGTLVGPADGASTLNNLDLKLQVSQNNKIILQDSQKINNLAFEPIDFDFTKLTNSDLTKYKVKITLTNSDNNILDEIELDYEKLESEFLYKEGTIYKSDFQGCFNNDVCEDFEKTLGNCYDCNAAKQDSIKQEKQRYENSIKNDNNNNNVNSTDFDNSQHRSFIFILSTILVTLLLVLAISFFVLRGIRKK